MGSTRVAALAVLLTAVAATALQLPETAAAEVATTTVTETVTTTVPAVLQRSALPDVIMVSLLAVIPLVALSLYTVSERHLYASLALLVFGIALSIVNFASRSIEIVGYVVEGSELRPLFAENRFSYAYLALSMFHAAAMAVILIYRLGRTVGTLVEV